MSRLIAGVILGELIKFSDYSLSICLVADPIPKEEGTIPQPRHHVGQVCEETELKPIYCNNYKEAL